MSALRTAAIEFEREYARPEQLEASGGAPYLAVPARVAFMAGAAAMAEICANGHGPVLEELRQLRTQLEEFKCHGGRCVYD